MILINRRVYNIFKLVKIYSVLDLFGIVNSFMIFIISKSCFFKTIFLRRDL